MEQERRKFGRVLFESPAVLETEGTKYPGKVLDFSLKGALFEAEEGRILPESTTQLSLNVILSEDVAISMDCEAAYKRNRLIGLKCIGIDIESMTALKRIVELNYPDDIALLSREFETLCGD